MRPIDEHLDLVDIIDAAEHDWDDYMDECHETETDPVETFEDFIADAILAAGYRKEVPGRWYVCEYEYLNCSVCGEAMYTGCNSTKEAKLLKDHWKNYCPNCGAKMDGDTNV